MSTQTKDTVVINLFGGPNTRKSTNAKGVAYFLSCMGFRVELVQEYAKEEVWVDNLYALDNQKAVFTEQEKRMLRVKGKVDFIVTDAPLLHSIIYDKSGSRALQDLILDTHHTYRNMNFVLKRPDTYDTVGRYQSEAEAKHIDREIEECLRVNGIQFEKVLVEGRRADKLADLILDRLHLKCSTQ